VIVDLYQSLRKSEGVYEHQPLVKIEWDTVVALSDILESIKQNVMRVLIVTQFLFLLCNVHCNLYSLFHVSNCSVELECPLGFLGLVVNLSKEIVNELMSEGFNLYFGDHFNHIRDHLFTFSNIELKGLVVLLALLVVFSSATPLALTLIVLSDSKMLIAIFLICLQNNLCVFIHYLMTLSNNESLLSLSSKDKEFDSFLFESTSLAVFSDHQCALGKLRFGSENMLCFFRVI
jgi:uncharacterized membrane protein